MENKPTNQSAQIQEAKDRVAKTYPHINDWSDFMENYFGIEYVSELDYAINQVILEYSSSQLEAFCTCGKGLTNGTMLCPIHNKENHDKYCQSKSVNPPAQEVDVEKLAEKEYPASGRIYRPAFVNGYNQALQSKAGGYSLEDAIKFGVNIEAGNIRRDYSITASQQFLQSLTSTPLQTKGREVEYKRYVDEQKSKGLNFYCMQDWIKDNH